MFEKIHKQAIHWVDTEDQLATLCARWSNNNMLAVDTEFMRSQTYFPIAGLIQVNDGDSNYLIDPTVMDCRAFADVLQNKNVTKILHSCSEDLEVFSHLLGVVPVNLIDTQIAAAMTGYGFSIGYANLVQAVSDIQLPKGETRSDWLQRPLSVAQKEYAAIDVEYLYQIASILILKLKKAQRLEWVKEDCQQLLESFADNQSIDQAYLRIRQGWRLNQKQLSVLRALASWREREAQRRDIPRNRVIKEHSLLDIAARIPTHISQLRKFEGVTERMIRADGETMISLIGEAASANPESFPAAFDRPLKGTENKWSKILRQAVQLIADEKDIAPEILLKKREYEAITRFFIERENSDLEIIKDQLKQFVSGWREILLAETLATAICSDTNSSDTTSPDATSSDTNSEDLHENTD